MAVTADNLLAGVKRRCIVPASQISLQDSDILAMGDEIVKSCLIPLMESVEQDYFVVPYTVAVTASQSLYAIPYRATGRALRDIKISDASGNVRYLGLIALEAAHTYSASALTLGFYFIGDQIRLVPDVPSSVSPALTLQVWYHLPPSRMIASTSAAYITAVTATTITVSSVPSTIVTGAVVDFIQGKSGGAILGMDAAITNVAGTTITFGASVIPTAQPSPLQVGDYIALAGTAPILSGLPNEASSYLESLTSERVLQSIGDFEGANALAHTIGREKENLLKLVEPRAQGKSTIIVNQRSLLRGGKSSNRSWLYGG